MLSEAKEHCMPFITGEATSSVDTGTVIGGTILGIIAFTTLVTPFLGCLIYYN